MGAMSATLVFDETALLRELARLATRSRAAFAAACAERLLPAYERFSRRAGRGDPVALSRILARVWEHLLGDEMTDEEVSTELRKCMELIPGEDEEPYVDGQPYADDAATA